MMEYTPSMRAPSLTTTGVEYSSYAKHKIVDVIF